MSDKSTVHVIKSANRWVVLKADALRALRAFPTKQEAIQLALLYRHQGYDLVVHRQNGTIERWASGLAS